MYYFVIILVVLTPVYVVGMLVIGLPLFIANARLKLPFVRRDFVFALLPFGVLWLSWIVWWLLIGRGVYGFTNMVNQSFWAGILGGVYLAVKSVLHRHTTAAGIIGIIVITCGPFALSYFLYNVFPL
jgi:hypothetical protein